jgi:hypothetical protein
MGPQEAPDVGKSAKNKRWGGARPGAGRPAKQPGHRRLALSVTVADRHWANVHLYAEQHGLSASEVLDGMLACALLSQPYQSFLDTWYDTHTLEETLQHLAAGRERIVPKAPSQSNGTKEPI